MEEAKPILNLETRTFEVGQVDGEPRRIEVPSEDLLFIFKGMRPRNMSYDDFKIVRSILKKELARHLQGKIVHLSKVSDAVWANYTRGSNRKPKQRGYTYVKPKDDDEAVRKADS